MYNGQVEAKINDRSGLNNYTEEFPRKSKSSIIFYVICELTLNNTSRYQIMVQAKIIVQVTNTCGNSNRTL